MGLNVFVTGAGGYLGGVLVNYLANLAEVERITAMVHNKPFRPPVPSKVKIVKMDIRSSELADAVAGHDFVIHSAHLMYWLSKMPASVRDDINFNGIRNIAQAAVKNHVRGFLQASSISAYDYRYVIGKENIVEDDPIGSGDSPLYYMNSKAITEKILNEILGPSDTRLTLFRLGYITGPCDESVIPEFRKNAFLALGQNPRMNFIQESDAARAFAQAMQTSMPGAYNLVSDRTFRMSELYKTLGVKPIVIPLWMAYMVSYLLWRYFGSNMHPSFVREAFFDYVVSNQKLKATGWTPQYNGIEAVKTAI